MFDKSVTAVRTLVDACQQDRADARQVITARDSGRCHEHPRVPGESGPREIRRAGARTACRPSRVEEAVKAAKELGGPVWVVKAQIHAGGRGKAGGVKVVKSIEDVEKEAKRLLGCNAGHAPDRPEGQAGQPHLCRGRLGDREGILSLDAGRPREFARRDRRLDRRRHGHREGRARHAGEDRHHHGRSGGEHLPASCAARSPRRSASMPICKSR